MHRSLSFRHARLLPVVAALLLAAACSSSSGGNTTSTGGSGATTSTTTSTTAGPGGSGGGGGTGGSACPAGPGYTGSGQMLAVSSANAVVVDTTGAPITDLEIQLCGINICDSGMTDANGSVDVPGSSSQKLEQPVFKFGDGGTNAGVKYAKLGIPVTTAAPSFPNLVDAALPTTGTAFTPGGNVVSGGITLAIPAGDVVTVDQLNYEDADMQLFRAVQIPVTQESPVIMPSGLTIGILVGVAPLETTFCPAVGVTVPNTAGWPAGTAVEFYLHGVDVLQEWSVYGGWTKVSDGQVSADGTTVSTAPGDGFPVLESFAVVQAQ